MPSFDDFDDNTGGYTKEEWLADAAEEYRRAGHGEASVAAAAALYEKLASRGAGHVLDMSPSDAIAACA